MKRSAAPARRTPPKRGKPPARSRIKPKPRSKPRVKRKPWQGFEEEVKAEVRRRSGNRCELALEGCTGKATNFHHRKLRRFNDHRVCNCLHLCANCHMLSPASVHHNPGKSYLMGWMVRSTLDPAEVPVKPASRRP